MKEYFTYIPLAFGIRPFGIGKNTEYLSICHNVTVEKEHLGIYDRVIDPIVYPNPLGDWAQNWPFPMLYLGNKVNLGITFTGIYELNNDFIPGSKVTQSGYGKISIADYYDYMLVCDGSSTHQRDVNGVWTEREDLAAAAICDFKGQLIIGGLFSNMPNSVAWSDIGYADLTIDRSNIAGWMPMRWNGQVWDVRRLGRGIIVSGSGGVSLLTPTSEPDVGFGLIELSKTGLIGPMAIGGGGNDINPVLLLNEFGELILIGPDFNATALGYVDTFSEYEDCVICASEKHSGFFISNGLSSYLLTKHGLSSVDQCVSMVSSYGGHSVGAVKSIEPNTVNIRTELLDFGLRAIKTIQSVEIDAIGSGFFVDLYSTVDGNDYVYLKQQPVNANNICTSKMSGINFMIGVNCADYRNRIRGIGIRYKLSDKRFIRGIHSAANQANT